MSEQTKYECTGMTTLPASATAAAVEELCAFHASIELILSHVGQRLYAT